MKLRAFRYCLILFVLQISAAASFAQGRFDIVSFKAPAGWQRSADADAVQFTKSSGNSIGIMTLFKALPTGKEPRATFDASWDAIVKGLLTKVDTPQMQPAAEKNGWAITSGAAVGEKDGDKLVAMLISATGGGKVINLVVLYNSEAFQADIDSFISSIVLPKVPANASQTAQTGQSPNSGGGSVNRALVGLWTYYTTESNGYVNGLPRVTGGYMRREYLFNADGTYRFRAKDWLVYGSKNILYISERGTWSVNGSTLTIKPAQGTGGWWNKAPSGRTVGWGSRASASDYRPETVTYTFELRYSDLMKRTDLVLRKASATKRDGDKDEYIYSPRDGSLIDDPPGLN